MRTQLLMAALIAVPVACASPDAPDEKKFAEIIVGPLLDAATRYAEEGVVIALDRDCFPEKYDRIPAMLVEQFDSNGVSWITLAEGCDLATLPGEWVLRSKTHRMPYVQVMGDDIKRSVRWAYVCGPLCGAGEQVWLEWDGSNWRQTGQAMVAH